MPPPVELLDALPVPQPYRQPKGRDTWVPENAWEWEGFPEFIAFLDTPPALPEHLEWYGPFLKHLATHGEKVAAAMYARIGRSTMYRAITDDPPFAAEVDAAEAYFKARVEAGLMHSTRVTGNPAGVIVRNKGEQPMKYIEKTATLSVSVTTELTPDDGASLLRDMLGTTRLATQRLIAPTSTQETGSAPRALAPRTELEEPR